MKNIIKISDYKSDYKYEAKENISESDIKEFDIINSIAILHDGRKIKLTRIK